MKKILISIVVALVLCVGAIGTAVAVTAHHHNCVQARPTHFLYMCPVCERTKQVNQSVRPSRNPMCTKSSSHGYMVLVDQW